MKYCQRNWSTSSRSLDPPTDHTWLINDPRTHGPGIVSTTTEGPTLHFSEPRTSSVAVGNTSDGPTPQIHLPGSRGEMKPVKFTSPRPFVRSDPGAG